MPRWRRLCIDMNDDNEVIGASVEFYDDSTRDPNAVAVMARSDWTGRDSIELLDEMIELGWIQPSLPLKWRTYEPPA